MSLRQYSTISNAGPSDQEYTPHRTHDDHPRIEVMHNRRFEGNIKIITGNPIERGLVRRFRFSLQGQKPNGSEE